MYKSTNTKQYTDKEMVSTHNSIYYVNSMREFVSSKKPDEKKVSSHYVQLYQSDDFLFKSLEDFFVSGDAAVVIATSDHRKILDKKLGSLYRDKYFSFDAHEILSKFMINGLPDSEIFFNSVGKLIGSLCKSGYQVLAFGEMVSKLWAEGNNKGAIKLEKLWNGLQIQYSFALYCAYPMNIFKDHSLSTAFADMCSVHTHVLPTEKYAGLLNQEDRLREIAKLEQKAQSLEREIHKRKRLELQKDEFMSIVSHELKTPTTSLKAYTQVLQKRLQKKGDLDSANFIGKMDKQINKLTSLIEDLLDVSRIDAGKLQFHEHMFDLDDLINEIIEEIQRTTDKHTIVKNGSAKKKIYGDRDRIGQVVINFLTNAIKYSTEGNQIIVKVSKTKNVVNVSVQDFGMGIDPIDQAHIFERFYRTTGTKQSTYPGLGLGLFISAEIINRHKGKIWVESENGKGSTFFFSLPV